MDTMPFRDEKRMTYLLEKTYLRTVGQHGASDAEIAAAEEQMAEKLSAGGFIVAQIPEDYAAFLKLTDGYAWNGVRFFGTKPIRLDRDYTNPSLLERNTYYIEERPDRPLQDGCLVIGEVDDELLLYSEFTGRYDSLNASTMTPMRHFAEFEELFFYAVDALYYDCCPAHQKKDYEWELGAPRR